MMKPLIVKDVVLDDGVFEPVLTMVSRNIPELKEDLKLMEPIPFSVMEWRVDYFNKDQEQWMDLVMQGLKIIREVFPGKILIFTYRSFAEGGQSKILDRDLLEIRERAIASGDIDFIDMELYWYEVENMNLAFKYHELLNECNKKQVKIILSYHKFSEKERLPNIKLVMQKMLALGADISKVAVRIHSLDELENLKSISKEIVESLEIPHILIAMGAYGRESRYDKTSFASCMTYTSLRGAIAPGQLPKEELFHLYESE